MKDKEMKVNYDKIMIDELEKLNERPTILLHSCCGPCSTACIERLKEYADVTILYYNPNIYPESEYIKRKNEQLRLLSILNIPYIDIDYDYDNWFNKTKYLSEEKEGGKRCSLCFAIRLEKTAEIAKENNYNYFATTLTVSPYKNSQVINPIGIKIGEEKNIKFLPSDFKKKEGYKRSVELSKKYDLYRQHYCGCEYSLNESVEE